jgi:hypothetical protein
MKKTRRDSLTGPIISVPWNSGSSHISAWDRRRSRGARPKEYSLYFEVAQHSERRRDRVEIGGESLFQGTDMIGPVKLALGLFFIRVAPFLCVGRKVKATRDGSAYCDG